jgi:spore germination protein GerM
MMNSDIKNKDSELKKTDKKRSAPKRSVRRKKNKESYTRALMILTIMFLTTAVLVLTSFLLQNQMSTVSSENIEKASTGNVEKNSISKKNTNVQKEKNTDESEPDNKEKKLTAKLYFIHFNEQTEELEYKSIKTQISSDNPYKDILDNLISGPAETSLETSLPQTIGVVDINIKNKVAYVNLTENFLDGAYGDIAIARINQIVLTLTQFNTINSVELQINSIPIETMGDGRNFSWPISRRL